MWGQQSKASYFDTFTGGYAYGTGSECTSQPANIRTYVLTLKENSTIVSSLYSNVQNPDVSTFACIGVNGFPCAFNQNERPATASGATTSAACVINLPAGSHTFRFSAPYKSNTRAFTGSIAVWPL